MQGVIKFFRANPQALVLLIICIVLGLGTFIAVVIGLVTAPNDQTTGEPSGSILGAQAAWHARRRRLPAGPCRLAYAERSAGARAAVHRPRGRAIPRLGRGRCHRRGMTEEQFENGYWYATELRAFARELGIPSACETAKGRAGARRAPLPAHRTRPPTWWRRAVGEGRDSRRRLSGLSPRPPRQALHKQQGDEGFHPSRGAEDRSRRSRRSLARGTH